MVRVRLVAGVALCLAATARCAELRVQPDKENVVASRLEGTWRPHVALTQRLAGRPPKAAGEEPTGTIRFQSDPDVAADIPAKYRQFLADQTIFLAGRMTARGKVHPFLLIAIHGNPHVLYFRGRDGDPMGDGESFNLILAPAREPASDLLFIGGDFNNQPFAAYERQPDAGAAAAPVRATARRGHTVRE